MTRYPGRERVEPGIYFSFEHLSFVSMDETGQLPGGPETAYRRVPAVALLVVGPLVGLAYVIFLPLISFVMLGAAVASAVAGLARDAARATVRVLQPAWQPARAFLSRREAEDEETPPATGPEPAGPEPAALDDPAPDAPEAPDDWAAEVRRALAAEAATEPHPEKLEEPR